MFWIAIYAALATVAAVAVHLLAEWHRDPGVPAPDRPGLCAVAAGLLWPLLVLGIAQWGLVVAVQVWLCGAIRHADSDGTRGVPLPAAR